MFTENGRTIIEVTLFDLPDPARNDPATRADAAVVRAFLNYFPKRFAQRYRDQYRANPARYGDFNWDDVELRLKRFSGIQVEGVESDLLAIAGGVAPDVLYVNFRKSDTYIQNGFLYPLDRPEDGYLTEMSADELAARVHEKIWPVIRRRGPNKQYHVWALPYGGALGRVVLYRKDLFDAAGLPYPDPNWTWDDLLAYARRLTRPEIGQYGLAMGRGKHESWYWVTFLWSAGGEVMTYDEANDEWAIVFDSEAGATALDFYIRLCTEPWTDEIGRRRYGYVYKDPRDSFRKWERGEIGMVFAYVDEKVFATVNPDITGMVPVPRGPDGHRGAELNSRMMGLFSGITHPAVRDAAWEYIRFFDGPEAMALRTRILVESGLAQFLNPRYLKMFGYEALLHLSPPGWAETFAIAIETGRPEPYGRHSNIAYNLMTEPIHRAEHLALSGRLPREGEARRAILAKLLREAAERARSEMLGVVPPKTRRLQRATAAIVLLALAIGFTLIAVNLARTVGAAAAGAGQRRRHIVAYTLLAPALAAILIWRYVPLVRGAAMAFQDYRLLGQSPWVGLDNFGAVLWNAEWWSSVLTAGLFSASVIGLTFLPPVFLALLINEIPRGGTFFRLVYYLPAVTTGLVSVLLWKLFYEPDERGLLNSVILRIPAACWLALGALALGILARVSQRLRAHEYRAWAAATGLCGLALAVFFLRVAWPMLNAEGVPLWKRLALTYPEPIRWLLDRRTALPACVLPLLWTNLGPGSLLYLAALKSVPEELYEAAEMDGATFTDKILFIVFPLLRPVLWINFLGVFIASWYAATDVVLAMTGGAAGTEIAGLHIFYKAFIFLQFGPATAMAWILAVFLIGFTVLQLRMLARVEFRAAGAVTR